MRKSKRQPIAAFANSVGAWLTSEPVLVSDDALAPEHAEAMVSGNQVVELILQCIRERTPVVLSGPRGCGKSRCAREAIRRAVVAGYIFGNAKDANSWGQVVAQGNKELPRDSLQEDEARIGKVGGNVSLELKDAPLVRFGAREANSSKLIIRNGHLVLDPKWSETPKPFVLFLDEINRFSDGVLDSLLLLLEERQVIRDGQPVTIDCAVVMTMNPPGYDGTAKRLSPPLQSRLGRVIQLCTPDLATTIDITLSLLRDMPADLRADPTREIGHERGDLELVKRACLASIALWGNVKPDETAYRYLTPASRSLLRELAALSHLSSPMAKLAEYCLYGPDVRAVKFWVLAALARRRTAEPLLEPLIQAFPESMLHRLSTRFVEASSPVQLADVERAARDVIKYVLRLLEPKYLSTIFDLANDEKLVAALRRYWGADVRGARAAWNAAGEFSDDALRELLVALTRELDVGPLPEAPKLAAHVAQQVQMLPGRHSVIAALEGTRIVTRSRAFDAWLRSLWSDWDECARKLQRSIDAWTRIEAGLAARLKQAKVVQAGALRTDPDKRGAGRRVLLLTARVRRSANRRMDADNKLEALRAQGLFLQPNVSWRYKPSPLASSSSTSLRAVADYLDRYFATLEDAAVDVGKVFIATRSSKAHAEAVRAAEGSEAGKRFPPGLLRAAFDEYAASPGSIEVVIRDHAESFVVATYRHLLLLITPTSTAADVSQLADRAVALLLDALRETIAATTNARTITREQRRLEEIRDWLAAAQRSTEVAQSALDGAQPATAENEPSNA